MLTTALLETDWILWRITGHGLRPRPIVAGHADPTAPADILTSIIWLPTAIAEPLHAVAVELVERQPEQHAYPAAAIHSTIVGPAGRPGQAVESILDDLRDVAPMVAGTRIRVAGLHLGPSTVFARLEATGGDLTGARRALRDRWGAPRSGGMERLFRERLHWTTIIRCTKPPSRAFIAAVAGRRRFRSDWFPLEGIELARSNRVMAPDRTVVVGRVRVGA